MDQIKRSRSKSINGEKPCQSKKLINKLQASFSLTNLMKMQQPQKNEGQSVTQSGVFDYTQANNCPVD